jgi:hypothetical protein
VEDLRPTTGIRKAAYDLTKPDPRLTFLLRASVKLRLVETGFQDLDTAFADLVVPFREIAVPPCQCELEILDNFERIEQQCRGRRRRAA